jgi:predicted nucleic acid-binding Zn ribbon protein
MTRRQQATRAWSIEKADRRRERRMRAVAVLAGAVWALIVWVLLAAAFVVGQP